MSVLPPSRVYDLILDALGEDYIVGLSDSEVRRRNRDASRTYGEVTLVFVQWFIREFAVGSESRILDVGSGVGNFSLAVAALAGATSYGVEIDESLNEYAQANAVRVRRALTEAGYDMGTVTLYGDDARRVRFSSRPLTHVFINNFAIDDETCKDIVRSLIENGSIVPGTIMVLIKPLLWARNRPDSIEDELFRRFRMPVEIHSSPLEAVSWKATPVDTIAYQVVARQNDESFGFQWLRAYNALMATRSNYGERN